MEELGLNSLANLSGSSLLLKFNKEHVDEERTGGIQSFTLSNSVLQHGHPPSAYSSNSHWKQVSSLKLVRNKDMIFIINEADAHFQISACFKDNKR